jgi:hypothetical protein
MQIQNLPVFAPKRIHIANKYVNCTMDIIEDWASVSIHGSVKNPSPFAKMELIAASPIDRMTNYSGSGLPFPCAAIAMDGTPNYKEIGSNGSFSAVFAYPNAFYAQDAFEKIPPSIFVRLFFKDTEKEPLFIRMELPEPTPTQVRTLTHRPNRYNMGPAFYSTKTDVIGVKGAYDTMLALRDAKIYRELA